MAKETTPMNQLCEMRADFMNLGKVIMDLCQLLTIDDVIEIATETVPTHTGHAFVCTFFVVLVDIGLNSYLMKCQVE